MRSNCWERKLLAKSVSWNLWSSAETRLCEGAGWRDYVHRKLALEWGQTDRQANHCNPRAQAPSAYPDPTVYIQWAGLLSFIQWLSSGGRLASYTVPWPVSFIIAEVFFGGLIMTNAFVNYIPYIPFWTQLEFTYSWVNSLNRGSVYTLVGEPLWCSLRWGLDTIG